MSAAPSLGATKSEGSSHPLTSSTRTADISVRSTLKKVDVAASVAPVARRAAAAFSGPLSCASALDTPRRCPPAVDDSRSPSALPLAACAWLGPSACELLWFSTRDAASTKLSLAWSRAASTGSDRPPGISSVPLPATCAPQNTAPPPLDDLIAGRVPLPARDPPVGAAREADIASLEATGLEAPAEGHGPTRSATPPLQRADAANDAAYSARARLQPALGWSAGVVACEWLPVGQHGKALQAVRVRTRCELHLSP